MTRRSFFAALAAPAVAPLIPAASAPQPPAIRKSIEVAVPVNQLSADERHEIACALIDAINKEVEHGTCRLTATDVKR